MRLVIRQQELKSPITNMDDEMVSDNFDNSYEDDLVINCNIISVLPRECDCLSKESENENDVVGEEAANQKPLCYYVMNNGVVKEQ